MNAVLNIAFQPVLSQKVASFLTRKPRAVFGLAASVRTSNLSAAHRLVPRIKAGTVWVNCHNLVDPNMPFGGYKQSGFGREHGRGAVEMYTEQKSVCISI